MVYFYRPTSEPLCFYNSIQYHFLYSLVTQYIPTRLSLLLHNTLYRHLLVFNLWKTAFLHLFYMECLGKIKVVFTYKINFIKNKILINCLSLRKTSMYFSTTGTCVWTLLGIFTFPRFVEYCLYLFKGSPTCLWQEEQSKGHQKQTKNAVNPKCEAGTNVRCHVWEQYSS